MIGILGLGSLAALVFASIGFLVSATVSISERIGEFALLKALGLAPRQLLLWLTIENLALLITGLVLGTLLGLVLAWLVLPFATLTSTGEPPVPAPVDRRPARGRHPHRDPGRGAGARDGRPGDPAAPVGAHERGPPREGRVAMRWLGLALRRIGDDTGATVGFAVLVLVTALIAGLAPRVLAGLADHAVRAEVGSAAVQARSIVFLENRIFGLGPDDDPLKQVRDAGDDLHDTMDVGIQDLVKARDIQVESGRFRVQKETTDPAFVRLRIQEGIADHIRYVAGRPPTSTVTARNDVGPEHTNDVPVYEAAISSTTADSIRDLARARRCRSSAIRATSWSGARPRTSSRSRPSPGSTTRSIPTRTGGWPTRSSSTR